VQRIFWNHRGGHDSGGFLYTPFLVRTILRYDPVFLANSTAGAEFLTKTFSLPPTAVRVVRNAFISEFDGTEAIDTSHQSRRSIGDGLLRLVHVANFFPEKDGETLLRGMAILKRRHVAFHLCIAGSFPDPTYRVALQELAADLDIADNVTFSGTLNRQELADLLCRSDVGILSSRTEGMPNSVMEYMYWSLPVVATDIPGVRGVVGEENSNWLFPVGDATGLADILASLASTKTLRRTIGSANRQLLVANFSPERIMPQWLRLLHMDQDRNVVP
jgi:glycosyltransferase involved in cell wall biosynthesis